MFHRGAVRSSFPWPAEPAAAEPAAAAAMPLPDDDDDMPMPLPDDDELELHERPPPEGTIPPHDYIPEIWKNGCFCTQKLQGLALGWANKTNWSVCHPS